MGCCPSKHKATAGADLSTYNMYPSTDKIDINITVSDRPLSATLPVHEDGCAHAGAFEAPNNMLMDRGDGRAMEYSDHEANDDCIAIIVDKDNQVDHEIVRPAEETTLEESLKDVVPPVDIVVKSLDVESTPKRVQHSPVAATPVPPPSAPTSPSKPPMNFDDIPISSMYHRIHVVEMEEQENKRRQEQQEEAERREREIQEFKAAMRASQEG